MKNLFTTIFYLSIVVLTAQNTELTVELSTLENDQVEGQVSISHQDVYLESEIVNNEAYFDLGPIPLNLDIASVDPKLYPNPSLDGQVNLELPLGRASISVYGLDGKRIGQFDSESTHSAFLETNHRLIVFAIQTENKTYHKKLFINQDLLLVNLTQKSSASEMRPSINTQSSGENSQQYDVVFSHPGGKFDTVYSQVNIELGVHNKHQMVTSASRSRLIVNRGSQSGYYPISDSVEISANQAEVGWVFTHWYGNTDAVANAYSAVTKIKIGENDQSVTAQYKLSDNKVQLPIEVMGAPGHVEEIILDLSDKLDMVNHLFVLVHNVSYQEKASLRVNDGNWLPISNNNAVIQIGSPDKEYGGFGGGYSSIKFTISKDDLSLIDGENTIAFRYNMRNGPTAGYRVIKVNFNDANGNSLIPEEVFVQDDPTLWEPVLKDQEDIIQGEALWSSYDLGIKAKCADCHTSTGMDLKYFNVSNKTIVEQAKKSGLTQIEGEQIASYIRSLDFEAPPQARPYNPPYQPGPGLDDKPAFEWAAGAGLDMVLGSDEEMLPYIFPEGTSDEALQKVFDLKGTLNIREMPVAFQLPDWLEWIPETHPKDMMSDESYNEVVEGIGLWNRPAGTYGYNNVKEDLAANGVDFYNQNRGQLMSKLENLGSGPQDFLFKDWTDSDGVFWWTITASPGLEKNTTNLRNEEYKLNLAKFNAIKHWEIMHEFDIQGVQPKGEPYAERMQWPFNNWTVFAIAPHIVGDQRGNSTMVGQDQEVGYYFSMAWYQLQMILNSGMRNPSGVTPVDWSYNFAHITLPGHYTGYLQPLLLFQNLLKAYQQRDNDVLADGNQWVNGSAWVMREVSPWRLYSDTYGIDRTHAQLDEYEGGLRAKLTSQMLRMFMEKVNSLDESDWPRGYDEWENIEPADYVPTANDFGGCLFPNPGSGCTDIQNTNEANAIYTIIPLFQEMGVDSATVIQLVDWATQMWPLGNWDKFKRDCNVQDGTPFDPSLLDNFDTLRLWNDLGAINSIINNSHSTVSDYIDNAVVRYLDATYPYFDFPESAEVSVSNQNNATLLTLDYEVDCEPVSYTYQYDEQNSYHQIIKNNEVLYSATQSLSGGSTELFDYSRLSNDPENDHYKRVRKTVTGSDVRLIISTPESWDASFVNYYSDLSYSMADLSGSFFYRLSPSEDFESGSPSWQNSWWMVSFWTEVATIGEYWSKDVLNFSGGRYDGNVATDYQYSGTW